ncbi:MAG: hypothetical protein FH749_08675 [Firmicutes bacterium]|nr:hypothetical protein [Bacillota bacterium]
MKRIHVFALVLVLIVPTVVFAQGSDNVTGKFGVAHAPEVTGIEVYTNEACTEVATSLTPQQEYFIKIDVSDEDGIDTVLNLEVRLWYDVDGAITDTIMSDSSQIPYPDKGFVFLCYSQTGAIFIPFNKGSWDVGEAIIEQHTDTTASYTIPVTIGKLAMETTTDDDAWMIGVYAKDELHTPDDPFQGEAYYEKNGTAGLPMNWYGEIVVEENTAVDWGNIPGGTKYSDDEARQELNQGISYLSNGTYGEQAKAAKEWDLIVGEGQASRVAMDPTVANNFSLKVGKTQDHSAAETLDSSEDAFVSIQTGNERAVFVGTTAEGEEVANPADYNLFIELATEFTVGTYSGSITFGIFNDHE